MQIVIDIPEKTYGCVKYGIDFDDPQVLRRAILNGTPLPKGHGRLIDADKLVAYFFRPYSNEEYYVNTDMENIIKNAPTVLEADKGDSDGCK